MKKIRLWVVFFILALVGSGITAFPIEWGLGILSRIMNISPAVPADTYTGMHHWLAFAYQGVLQTNATYPFIFYGTDWLAFAHLVILLLLWVYISGLSGINGLSIGHDCLCGDYSVSIHLWKYPWYSFLLATY